jgi:hypothetical protein
VGLVLAAWLLHGFNGKYVFFAALSDIGSVALLAFRRFA